MAQRRLKQNFNEVQAILDAVGQKVDKIEGKGLSANDYTDQDKNKLASVEEDAQENVIEVIESDGVELPIENKTVRIPAHKQSDWSQNDSSGKDYIKNRTHWEENGVVHKLHPKFLDMDASPTSGSTKPVTSGGVKEALDGKQDVIRDLADIRQGAGLGGTAYQKPSTGIPASDLAAGVIPDVSGFITRTVNDLANYYLKSETYTKEEVAALIGAIQQFHYEVYAALPATGEGNVLYLIGPTGSGSDKYEEYVYANNGWVKIGDTSIDLSGYVTIEALNQALAGYVTSAALATALTGKVGSETIHNIVELTQAEYDALQTKRDDTMYIITDTEIPSSEVGIAGFEQTTESTEDGGTNIWTVTLTNGQTFQLAVKNGTKGQQGNTGSSVDYPYELVNNLTTDDATKGLSAAMGKALEDEIAAMIQPNTLVDLSISDEANMAIVQFADGHVRTKFFDSADIAIAGKIISRYKGKKISILGDSISTFGDPSATNENGTYCYSYYPSASCRYSVDGVDSIAFDVADTYWMRLINATGMVLGINESYRGTRVSGTGSTAFNNQTRINHLGENGTPDVILVFGGTNDAGGNVTIGTFDTTNPQGYTDEEIAALPVSTFADAYRTMLIRLIKTYPLAEIVVILPTFTTSYYTITNLDLYVEIIKEACDFFGIKYIDARCTGINVYNRGTYLSDGIHPNTEGMRLLYEKILRQLLFV